MRQLIGIRKWAFKVGPLCGSEILVLFLKLEVGNKFFKNFRFSLAAHYTNIGALRT